nr:hypothetical protein L203_00844 [Cryptococcus depauperatus CBS 7841]
MSIFKAARWNATGIRMRTGNAGQDVWWFIYTSGRVDGAGHTSWVVKEKAISDAASALVVSRGHLSVFDFSFVSGSSHDTAASHPDNHPAACCQRPVVHTCRVAPGPCRVVSGSWQVKGSRTKDTVDCHE